MSASNEILMDLLLRHQVHLRRFETHIQRRVLSLLQDTETDLRNIIADQFPLGHTISHHRYTTMEKTIVQIRKKALQDAFDYLNDQLNGLVTQEAEFTARSIEKSLPVIFETLLPSPSTLTSLVSTTPLQGQLMSVWANKLARDDVVRITSQLRLAMIEGQTGREAAERIVGSVQLKGTNGQTIITARHAETIAQTALQTYANAARQQIFESNAEIIQKERYTATLDRRTTVRCAGLDGEFFKAGQGPKPPIHWRCRSVRVAVIDNKVLGNRPFNPTTEKQLISEYNKKNGLPPNQEIGYGHKGKFDRFSMKRKREMIGQVPAKTTYQEWFKRQPKWFQEDVLGKERALMFRSGKISLKEFVDYSGKEYTLKQLKAIYF